MEAAAALRLEPQVQQQQQQQQQRTPRPPSPFLTQLNAYYNQLALRTAREARAVPSHVWTEMALRETALHDWPENILTRPRWRKSSRKMLAIRFE